MLFRIVGLLVLALALVLAVLDITRSITAAGWLVTPLGELWLNNSAGTLTALRDMLSTTLHPFLWDPVMLFILSLPGWLVLFTIALLLLWSGQPRENPFGRFASR